MAKRHLTQADVDAEPFTPKGERKYLWDDEAPGLGLVVNPTKKTWRWQFDRWADGNKKTIYKTLDGAFKLKEARAWAKEQTVLARRGAFDEKPPEPTPLPPGPEAWTVKEALNKRLEWMKANGFAASTVKTFEKQIIPYLAPIHAVVLGDLTKSKCQEVHALISKTGLRGDRGAPVSANAALNYLSATWLHAKDKHDDHNRMPHRSDNPCQSIDRNPVGKVQDSITTAELPQWVAIVAGLTPVKRNMHMIGLFTGLRWTSLRCIERAWVQGDRLVIPADNMKARRADFAVPLSAQLVDLFGKALEASRFVAPNSKYLFPSLTSSTGHMATDDERALKAANTRWDGKLRRKTYYTQAGKVPVPDKVRSALMDHSVPGLRGNYEHQEEMHEDLLKWQQLISDRLTILCCPKHAYGQITTTHDTYSKPAPPPR